MPGSQIEKAVLYVATGVVNEFGERDNTYTASANLTVEALELKSDEKLAKSQIYGKDTIKLKTRYSPLISRLCRLLYRNEYYDIVDVSDFGRREWVYLTVVRSGG